MPIYEYRCDDCGHEFETIQKVSDEPLKQCPSCEHDALRKKVSAAAFRLKGGGWYETDFKSDKKRNVAGEAKGGEKSDGSSEGAGGGDKGSTDGAGSGGDNGKSAGGTGGKSTGESKGAGGASSKTSSE